MNWVAESQRFTVGRLACLSDGITERCLRPDMGGGMLGFLKTGNRPNRPGESEPGRACTAPPQTPTMHRRALEGKGARSLSGPLFQPQGFSRQGLKVVSS